MPKVTHLAWPVATGLGGALLKTDGHRMVCPDMAIEASGGELAELLGNVRLAKVCQKMGHSRAVAEFTGVTQLTETVNGEDFSRGLEISGATVEMSLNGDDSVAMFQGVHGVIWNRCHFTIVRSMTSKSEDSGELSRMTAVTTFFKECHQMFFKECTFVMKVTYRLQMEQLEYQEETEDSDWEGSSDTLSYGGGGGAGGGAGGSGGWSSGQLSYEDALEHPEEEEDEEYILPWTGAVCIAFWMCDNVTIFGGSCTMESICNSTGGDACAVCLGLFQCNGPEHKGLEKDGSCSMPGGLMAGRIGWMNVSGVQKTGMRFTTTARAAATPDTTQDTTCISLTSQAVSGGMMRCHYVTPVYTRVNCLSHAEVKPMASTQILGVSIARAFGYDDVLADLTNSGNEAVCSAEAFHPDRRQMAGGRSQACEGLVVTGTEPFYSN